MNHLSELLKRLELAETAYKTSKSSLDGSLEFILAKEQLKRARMEWFYECEAYILSNVLFNNEEEIEA